MLRKWPNSGSRKRHFATLILFSIPCLWFSEAAIAEKFDATLLSENDFFNEVPVVLSATRLAQPANEVPTAITIIDRELIDASGARDIPELFRMVAGFQVSYDSGHSPFASYHGFVDEYARRMQVLVDGRSIYMPFDGGVHWSELALALDDIERIEVIRGPNSATYGANSFLGVVNIITRHASENVGSYVRLNNSPSEPLNDAVLRFGGTTGDFDYRLTLGYQDDSGFAGRIDDRQVKFASFRGDYRIGVDDIFNVSAGYNTARRGAGYADLERRTFNPPHDVLADTGFTQLRWWHFFSPTNELQIQFYQNRHDQREEFLTEQINVGLIVGVPEYLIQIPINYDVFTERYDLELQHTFQPHPIIRAVWGVNARLDRVKSRTFMNTDDFTDNNLYSFFGNIEWRPSSKMTANIGATHEYNDITGHDASPRLAINYHINANHTLRGSISTAIRSPVLFEEKIDYKLSKVINGTEYYNRIAHASGGLRPERILSREIAYIYQRPGVSLDIKLFNDRITDLITAFQRIDPNDIWQDQTYEDLANSENAKATGIETQIDLHYTPNGRLLLGYAVLNVDSSDRHREFSASVPPTSFGILISQKFVNDIFRRGIHASAGYYYYDSVNWLSEGDHVDDTRRLDIRLAQQFYWGHKELDIAIVLQNILDPYVEFRSEPDGLKNEFSTRAYISLALDLL